MRTRDKIRTIKAATTREGSINIEAESVLNGAEYQISNWLQVSKALDIVIEGGLMTERSGSEAERYISQMLSTRPDTAEVLLPSDQYSQFVDYVNDYASELPRVLQILEAVNPDDFRDDAGKEGFEFAVELNIGEKGSIDETRIKVDSLLHLFGKMLSIDGQVSIKGFDTGSDWIVFCAANELQAEFIGYVLACAADVTKAMVQYPKETLRLVAKAVVGRLGSDQDGTPSESSLSEAMQDFIDELRDQKIDEMLDELKGRYPEQENLLNESRKRAQDGVDTVTALHSQGVKFQLPEQAATVININIEMRDNGIVNLPPIPQMALPGQKGLNLEDNEDETDSDESDAGDA